LTAPLVSVFTAARDSGDAIEAAFRSLLRQTHESWEWVIVDDSTEPATRERIAELASSPQAAGRLRVCDRTGPAGSIGATKAAAAMSCTGDFLVELDHDDELLPRALELIAATFTAHREIDFVFSDWIDWIDRHADGGVPGTYGPDWAFGLGSSASEIVEGRRVDVALAPAVTRETVRHIVGMPNHVRAWRTEFYRRIGGHDARLQVGDDYELLARTFLLGTMARIPRPLYVQHHDSRGTTASRIFNADIQERVGATAARYRGSLDRRCDRLGLTPSGDSPLTGWRPVRSASPRLDVVAEADAARGTPLVSVIVPTYRRPDLLRQALESILDQTYSNLEVLVVGDACPESDGVIASIDEPRVRHVNLGRHHGDSGAAPRNHALKTMARGTLVAYLDDDNRWLPEHLESLVERLLAKPGASYAFSSFDIGETIVCRTPRRFQIDTSALLHRRSLLDRHGYWRPAAETDWAHDWELVSRWRDEPYVASLRPTLRYSLETSTGGRRALPAIRAAQHDA
jgi:glycosyltransferase involved in cell wall biosynthesis